MYQILLSYLPQAEQNPMELSSCGSIGVGWGIAGGEAVGMSADSYLAADGIENVIRVLEDLEDEKFTPNLQFIELNACSGGCVGGVLNVENPYLAKAKTKHLSKYLPDSLDRPGDHPAFDPEELYFTQPITYEPVYRLGSNTMESMANLEIVERYMKEFPGLDCGSCGAPTCRALAEDIVRGFHNI